jgi:hypothetical protein
MWVIGAQVCCFSPHVSLGKFNVLKCSGCPSKSLTKKSNKEKRKQNGKG